MFSTYLAKLMLLVFVAGTSIEANAQAKCPGGAVQTLYNLKHNVRTGKENTPKKIFGYSDEALRVCADNATAQALAAELFTILGASVPRPQDKFTAYSKAWDALYNHGKVYKSLETVPKVKTADGTMQPLFTNANTIPVLKQVIVGLANLDSQVYSHDMFIPTYTTQKRCPHRVDSRVSIEAQALFEWADTDAKRRTALARLEGLWTVCPHYRSKTLSYHLAQMNTERAQHNLDKNLKPEVGLRYATHARTYANHNMDMKRERHVNNNWSSTDDQKLKNITKKTQQKIQGGR